MRWSDATGQAAWTIQGSADAIDLFLDYNGVNAGALSVDWATVFTSTGDRKG